MKPDWEDAPDWAQWLALDASGEWYWYEIMPSTSEIADWWITRGKFQVAHVPKWKDSLERRPDETALEGGI